MPQLCRYYTVMEVKALLETSEGRGPGTGGHAISTHGYGRADVTSRGKPNDSAFVPSVSYKPTTEMEDSIMRGVLGDDYAPSVKKMVHLSDQALAVCNALNSEKGQTALQKLDRKQGAGPHQTAFVADLSLGCLNPFVRAGHGGTASRKKFDKIYVEPWKLNGELHLHTAYTV